MPENTRDQSLSELQDRIDKASRRSRWRIVVATLLPVVFGLLFLAYSLWTLGQAAEEVAILKSESDRLKSQVESLQVELTKIEKYVETTRAQLQASREATNYVRYALNLFHKNEFNAALAQYDHALRLDPENPYVANLKGYALFKAGRTDQAIEALRWAVEIDPEYAYGYFDLARALCRAGDFDAARSDAVRAIALRPELAAAMKTDGEFRRLCLPIMGSLEGT